MTGKTLVIRGEITGSAMLYIDGQVEGTVRMPGNRVIVGTMPGWRRR
jgi:cytoskeletal protein CcmA (bactofilin family)